MKKIIIPALFTFLVLSPSAALAHPGNTAADGCHYCRTNCAKWGEVESARHCHNAAPPITSAPTKQPTPVPTKRPTSMPTAVATPVPTKLSTPIPTTTPTPTPEQGAVLGDTNEQTPEPTPEPTSTAALPITQTADTTDADGSGAGIAAVTAIAIGGGAYALYRRNQGTE